MSNSLLFLLRTLGWGARVNYARNWLLRSYFQYWICIKKSLTTASSGRPSYQLLKMEPSNEALRIWNISIVFWNQWTSTMIGNGKSYSKFIGSIRVRIRSNLVLKCSHSKHMSTPIQTRNLRLIKKWRMLQSSTSKLKISKSFLNHDGPNTLKIFWWDFML